MNSILHVPVDSWGLLLSFLDTKDRLLLSHTHSQILFKFSIYSLQALRISQKEIHFLQSFQLKVKELRQGRPQHLQLNVIDSQYLQRLPQCDSVASLYLQLKYQLTLQYFGVLTNKFKNVRKLAIEANQLPADFIHCHVWDLESIKFVSQMWTDGSSLLQMISLKTVSICKQLFLRPHLIKPDITLAIVKKLPRLQNLMIDGQQFTNQDFKNLFQILPKQLKKLQISFAGQLSSIQRILGFKELNSLYIKKLTKQLPQSLDFSLLAKLQTIVLTENQTINDQVLESMAQCPILSHVRLEWLNKVTSQGVAFLTSKLTLSSLWLIGLKGVDDQAFPDLKQITSQLQPRHFQSKSRKYQEIVQRPQDWKAVVYMDLQINRPARLDKLKQFSCVKSDFVSDRLLLALRLVNPDAVILNYYGSNVMGNQSYLNLDYQQ